jgi:regulatory protein
LTFRGSRPGLGRRKTSLIARRTGKTTAPDSAIAAYERALKLLAVRARGRAELSRALETRGFDRAAVLEALDRLERQGWLDDLAAARAAARSRVVRYGRARIERELVARGFSSETIAVALSEIDRAGEEKALTSAFARLWKSHAGVPREKRRQRVWNALLRRGFAAEKISEIMKASHEVDGSSREIS